MDHKIFIQYRDGETLTTHAFYDEEKYFENTNDDDNDKLIYKLIYNYKEYKCFRTVGIFRYWLNSLYSRFARKECLVKKGAPCNIFNAHDVAVEIGVDCKYGCCCGCKHNRLCGACCNIFTHTIYKENSH